jgi:hypothetical protein
VLQARLQARAAAGVHFMPASLLDSQLQQLEIPDPSELYMCFGDPFGGCGSSSGSDADSGGCSAAAACCVNPCAFPSGSEIVAAILAQAHLVTGNACVVIGVLAHRPQSVLASNHNLHAPYSAPSNDYALVVMTLQHVPQTTAVP